MQLQFAHQISQNFSNVQTGGVYSAIGLPFVVFLIETCDVIQTSLSSYSLYQQVLANANWQDPLGNLSQLCLFGNGGLINQLQMQSFLLPLTNISQSFGLQNSYFGGNSLVSNTVANQTNWISRVINGTVPANYEIIN